MCAINILKQQACTVKACSKVSKEFIKPLPTHFLLKSLAAGVKYCSGKKSVQHLSTLENASFTKTPKYQKQVSHFCKAIYK